MAKPRASKRKGTHACRDENESMDALIWWEKYEEKEKKKKKKTQHSRARWDKADHGKRNPVMNGCRWTSQISYILAVVSTAAVFFCPKQAKSIKDHPNIYANTKNKETRRLTPSIELKSIHWPCSEKKAKIISQTPSNLLFFFLVVGSLRVESWLGDGRYWEKA